MASNEAVQAAAAGGLSVEAVHDFARQMVERWSEQCQRFLDNERRYILRQEPSAEERRGFEAATMLMLSLGRAIYMTVASPLYPDQRLANEVHGRLIQLEHSWQLAHNPMSDAEARHLMQEVFPGDPLAEKLFPNAA
jgi:hypothetical protein